jgi:hypothetical protein
MVNTAAFLSPDDSPPDGTPPEHPDLAAVLGPARLAYFTPVFDQPSLADRKAMFILGASGLLVTVLMFFAPPLHTVARSGGRPATVALVAAILCVIGLVLTAAVAAYVAYTRPLPPMPPTLALFREVCARDADAYVAAMYALDHRRAMRDMLHYNYSVATQAAAKFRIVNRSLSILRVAILLWMVLLLVLAISG